MRANSASSPPRRSSAGSAARTPRSPPRGRVGSAPSSTSDSGAAATTLTGSRPVSSRLDQLDVHFLDPVGPGEAHVAPAQCQHLDDFCGFIVLASARGSETLGGNSARSVGRGFPPRRGAGGRWLPSGPWEAETKGGASRDVDHKRSPGKQKSAGPGGPARRQDCDRYN
jgi:hypothetical protein